MGLSLAESGRPRIPISRMELAKAALRTAHIEARPECCRSALKSRESSRSTRDEWAKLTTRYDS
jgi:hypothetical protein